MLAWSWAWAGILAALLGITFLAVVLLSVLGGRGGVGPGAEDDLTENYVRREAERQFERPRNEGDLL